MNALLTPLPAGVFAVAEPTRAVCAAFDESIRRGVDSLVLGQYWLALHFTLSGEVPFPSTEARRQGVSWPDDALMDALMGGEDARMDDDFGGARFHRPPAVSRIARELLEISDEELRERFDPDALIENEIPPLVWAHDPDAVESIVTEFARLKAFYSRCAAHGEGVLVRAQH